MEEFKVGDRVKIINTGHLYSNYVAKARELGATKWLSYSSGEEAKRQEGRIVAIDNKERILLIDQVLHEILMDFRGVEKIEND